MNADSETVFNDLGAAAGDATGSRAAEQILDYHRRTKHSLERYARGPETLDWSAQPDPFRVYTGTERVPLPLAADALTSRFAELDHPHGVAPQPVSLVSIGILFELSLGLSAWKEYGPDRWALRCNPSSGNLHPTEAYLLCASIPELADGVYHYVSREHVLERRYQVAAEQREQGTPLIWIGLSSIHWREAWKYGERAFRYCQLDLGHAIGALAYAAATLGWQATLLQTPGSTTIAALLGLDRSEDFGKAEREEPELLLAISPGTDGDSPESLPYWYGKEGHWSGQANLLDPHPIYHWPVIDEVASASRKPATHRLAAPACAALPADCEVGSGELAANLIRRRRSAQAFDKRQVLPLAVFYRLLTKLLPFATVPWSSWEQSPKLHPVLFVHRVADLAPGLYALPRYPEAEALLRAQLDREFLWCKAEHSPEYLPLFRLTSGDGRAAARTISCQQAIASDSAFTLGLLAEFDETLQSEPWRYRCLYWEAGLLGQVLYLEAEQAQVRGTGIGCFFDDAFHELLGIRGERLQSIYHFTVGSPLEDPRILTLPPYSNEVLL